MDYEGAEQLLFPQQIAGPYAQTLDQADLSQL
jgi:hypothetical protein